MIQIIVEDIVMPSLYERRYKKQCINNKWSVLDTETNTVRYKGRFEDVCLVWHNLNKKYYRDNDKSNL